MSTEPNVTTWSVQVNIMTFMSLANAYCKKKNFKSLLLRLAFDSEVEFETSWVVEKMQTSEAEIDF